MFTKYKVQMSEKLGQEIYNKRNFKAISNCKSKIYLNMNRRCKVMMPLTRISRIQFYFSLVQFQL